MRDRRTQDAYTDIVKARAFDRIAAHLDDPLAVEGIVDETRRRLAA